VPAHGPKQAEKDPQSPADEAESQQASGTHNRHTRGRGFNRWTMQSRSLNGYMNSKCGAIYIPDYGVGLLSAPLILKRELAVFV